MGFFFRLCIHFITGFVVIISCHTQLPSLQVECSPRKKITCHKKNQHIWWFFYTILSKPCSLHLNIVSWQVWVENLIVVNNVQRSLAHRHLRDKKDVFFFTLKFKIYTIVMKLYYIHFEFVAGLFIGQIGAFTITWCQLSVLNFSQLNFHRKYFTIEGLLIFFKCTSTSLFTSVAFY